MKQPPPNTAPTPEPSRQHQTLQSPVCHARNNAASGVLNTATKLKPGPFHRAHLPATGHPKPPKQTRTSIRDSQMTSTPKPVCGEGTDAFSSLNQSRNRWKTKAPDRDCPDPETWQLVLLQAPISDVASPQTGPRSMPEFDDLMAAHLSNQHSLATSPTKTS